MSSFALLSRDKRTLSCEVYDIGDFYRQVMRLQTDHYILQTHVPVDNVTVAMPFASGTHQFVIH